MMSDHYEHKIAELEDHIKELEELTLEYSNMIHHQRQRESSLNMAMEALKKQAKQTCKDLSKYKDLCNELKEENFKLRL